MSKKRARLFPKLWVTCEECGYLWRRNYASKCPSCKRKDDGLVMEEEIDVETRTINRIKELKLLEYKDSTGCYRASHIKHVVAMIWVNRWVLKAIRGECSKHLGDYIPDDIRNMSNNNAGLPLF